MHDALLCLDSDMLVFFCCRVLFFATAAQMQEVYMQLCVLDDDGKGLLQVMDIGGGNGFMLLLNSASSGRTG